MRNSNVSHIDPEPEKGIAERRCRLCMVIRECARVLGATSILEARGDELMMEEVVDGELVAFTVRLSNRRGRLCFVLLFCEDLAQLLLRDPRFPSLPFLRRSAFSSEEKLSGLRAASLGLRVQLE